MRPKDPCRLREKTQIAPAALELSHVGPAVKIAESGLVRLPHFLGISDGDIPVLVRRYSSSDRRAKLLRA